MSEKKAKAKLCGDCANYSIEMLACRAGGCFMRIDEERTLGCVCGPDGRKWKRRKGTVPNMPKPPPPPPPKRETAASLLESAREIVNGDRQRDYGHPAENHECTAVMDATWKMRARDAGNLEKLGGKAAFAIETCAFNICQKLSRLAQTPNHTDSLRDIIGYALNWQMILDRANEKRAGEDKGKGGEG